MVRLRATGELLGQVRKRADRRWLPGTVETRKEAIAKLLTLSAPRLTV